MRTPPSWFAAPLALAAACSAPGLSELPPAPTAPAAPAQEPLVGLQVTMRVRGTVRTADGRPQPGVAIHATVSGAAEGPPAGFTAGDGRYEVDLDGPGVITPRPWPAQPAEEVIALPADTTIRLPPGSTSRIRHFVERIDFIVPALCPVRLRPQPAGDAATDAGVVTFRARAADAPRAVVQQRTQGMFPFDAWIPCEGAELSAEGAGLWGPPRWVVPEAADTRLDALTPVDLPLSIQITPPDTSPPTEGRVVRVVPAEGERPVDLGDDVLLRCVPADALQAWAAPCAADAEGLSCACPEGGVLVASARRGGSSGALGRPASGAGYVPVLPASASLSVRADAPPTVLPTPARGWLRWPLGDAEPAGVHPLPAPVRDVPGWWRVGPLAPGTYQVRVGDGPPREITLTANTHLDLD